MERDGGGGRTASKKSLRQPPVPLEVRPLRSIGLRCQWQFRAKTTSRCYSDSSPVSELDLDSDSELEEKKSRPEEEEVHKGRFSSNFDAESGQSSVSVHLLCFPYVQQLYKLRTTRAVFVKLTKTTTTDQTRNKTPTFDHLVAVALLIRSYHHQSVKYKQIHLFNAEEAHRLGGEKNESKRGG